ncbi:MULTISPECIES: DNA-binding protein YbiB [unclassified Tatumella]|uniref:DNA-binding protein YbiB n=1 Tax=unclassified Tatumella TaxID=2649542 RepID=UPI001BAECF2A|nr:MULTISPECIES: DNA-binding protein YbiB [unclassified Tatumella]MBS0875943.1 DNA-binding protein YbiB [Tatumella sp. JGM82]MBS0890348.1 DNA-binding protein YbiB [Tatumella sp. JGM94]MBS0900474.1 DNA-binding protein YbiB [Tatumella sp. JGM100]
MDIIRIVKEIGRGKNHARDLDQQTAYQLYQAMLDDQLDPLTLGAVLIALRIKGESDTEMLGFYRALQQKLPQLQVPAGLPLPVVIPSYNGARRQGNLTPLLALLLQKIGFPVFVHGIDHDPTRITSEAVFAALGIFPVSIAQAQQQLNQGHLAFITIDQWCPALARQLALRWQLGLRNSAHSLAKLASPFADDAALRLSAVSHPEYVPKVATFFRQTGAPALLLNGCEGEVYANPQRGPAIYQVTGGDGEPLLLTERQPEAAARLPDSKSAADTARWTQDVLEQSIPVPQPLRLQVACCLVASGRCATVAQGLRQLQALGY